MKRNNITFVAEVGMNHNGNFDLAYELIKQAKLSNADIVKFQLGWRDKPGELNVINNNIVDNLIEWSKYFDIELMFSIISDDALNLIKDKDLKKFKIASRTVIDKPELVKKILNFNKETFLSLGMWDKKGFPFSEYKNLRYLWCLSKYPTHPSDLINLPKDFNNSGYYGYSDHSIGIETCILAISRGAKMIEKHFTLNKSDQTIRDHTLSATPTEFKNMVDIGSDIFKKLQIGI